MGTAALASGEPAAASLSQTSPAVIGGSIASFWDKAASMPL
jgi:hypothetical protein